MNKEDSELSRCVEQWKNLVRFDSPKAIKDGKALIAKLCEKYVSNESTKNAIESQETSQELILACHELKWAIKALLNVRLDPALLC